MNLYTLRKTFKPGTKVSCPLDDCVGTVKGIVEFWKKVWLIELVEYDDDLFSPEDLVIINE